MGHERVGILPRRQRWNDIVLHIRDALEGDTADIATLVSKTLGNVRSRYMRLPHDTGVQAAFAYLVALSTSELPAHGGLTAVDTKLQDNPSPIRITTDLANWVNSHRASPEYAELSCRAAADTIAKWSREKSTQKLIFDNAINATSIWGNSDGRSFCTIARTFFAKFTERYLRYFIERSASAEAPSLKARQQLQMSLSGHIDEISQHAFETSKIIQSFAAGWFNKYARDHRPGDTEIVGFLTHAFGKLQEELAREDISK
jgi:glycine cleavage system H lipoate-binding protein